MSLSPVTCHVTFGTQYSEHHSLHCGDVVRNEVTKAGTSADAGLECSDRTGKASTNNINYCCIHFYYYCV